MKKKIIKEILNDPKLKELNQIEQARYVYIKLGEYFVYDTRFYTGAKTMKQQIYTRKHEDINDTIDNRVVCTSASSIYATILNKLNIKAEVKIVDAHENDDPNRLRHGYTVFEIAGKQYAADLIEDMNLIKVGLKTQKFMKNKKGYNYFEKTDKEIQQIDEKIGYIKNGIYPMEEYRVRIGRENHIIFDGNEEFTTDENEKIELEHIKSKLGGDKGIREIRKKFGVRDNMTAEEKCILKINYMIKKMKFDNLDSITKEVYLQEFAKMALSENDWASISGKKNEKKINTITCIDKNKAFIKFLVIEFKSGNNKIYQLAKDQPIQAITQKELTEKFDNGMKTYSTSKRNEHMKILTGKKYQKNNLNIFSINEIFNQILNGNTTSSKLNDITRETKKNFIEQIRISKMTNEEVSSLDLKGDEK